MSCFFHSDLWDPKADHQSSFGVQIWKSGGTSWTCLLQHGHGECWHKQKGFSTTYGGPYATLSGLFQFDGFQACGVKVFRVFIKFVDQQAPKKIVLVLSLHGLISQSCTRCSLILLLITAAGGVWLLENPGSSVVMKHDHMQNLIMVLKRKGMYVFRQTFWMAHYHHPNFKLTKIWSPANCIWQLDFGKLSGKHGESSSSTTRKYINKKGQLRFTGTKALKQSQYFVSCFGY